MRNINRERRKAKNIVRRTTQILAKSIENVKIIRGHPKVMAMRSSSSRSNEKQGKEKCAA